MDHVKALELKVKLKGQIIDGWTVESLINHGKSAAVFLAHKGHEKAAIKVFDNELITKYGGETQLARRIDRELTLIGHTHPNMVQLFGGGRDDTTGNYYIIMEYLDGLNLKQCLHEIPTENIGLLISQLADCGRFLEKWGLVHRDIKPENIVIFGDFTKLVLLDFGVLKLVGETGLTDDDGIQPFVGTLRYSSPEFLFRDEIDDVEGWKALTFYQIGGVLHDLLMQEELFAGRSEPYTRLVVAVRDDIPNIHNKVVPSYLVDLAKACLAKDPKIRTEVVDWSSFYLPKQEVAAAENAKARVTGRSTVTKASQEKNNAEQVDPRELLQTVIDTIKLKIRSIRASNSSSMPPVVVIKIGEDVTVQFGPNINFGLPLMLTICFSIEVLDANIDAISIMARAFTGNLVEDGKIRSAKVFSGIFSANTIASTLENCIYLAMEKAQDFGDEGIESVIDLGVLEG